MWNFKIGDICYGITAKFANNYFLISVVIMYLHRFREFWHNGKHLRSVKMSEHEELQALKCPSKWVKKVFFE